MCGKWQPRRINGGIPRAERLWRVLNVFFARSPPEDFWLPWYPGKSVVSSNCLGYLVSMMLKLSSNWWEYVDSFTPSNTPSPSKPPAMVYYNLKGLFPPSASLMFKGFKGDSLIIYFSNGKAAKQVVDKISEVNPPHLLKSARRTQTTKALASATSLDPIHPYFSETFTKITRCLRNTTIKRKH